MITGSFLFAKFLVSNAWSHTQASYNSSWLNLGLSSHSQYQSGARTGYQQPFTRYGKSRKLCAILCLKLRYWRFLQYQDIEHFLHTHNPFSLRWPYTDHFLSPSVFFKAHQSRNLLHWRSWVCWLVQSLIGRLIAFLSFSVKWLANLPRDTSYGPHWAEINESGHKSANTVSIHALQAFLL